MVERDDFRVVLYSIQRDHVHIIVEAAEKDALGRGMKAVASRLARAVNRVFGRSGAVMDGRYHLRVLGSPREVRNAIAYVLLNARKHWRERWGQAPPVRIDAASSGRWFGGWLREASSGDESLGVRASATFALGLMRAKGVDALPALIEGLSDESGRIRRSSALALARIGNGLEVEGNVLYWVVPRAYWQELIVLAALLLAWFALMARFPRHRPKRRTGRRSNSARSAPAETAYVVVASGR